MQSNITSSSLLERQNQESSSKATNNTYFQSCMKLTLIYLLTINVVVCFVLTITYRCRTDDVLHHHLSTLLFLFVCLGLLSVCVSVPFAGFFKAPKTVEFSTYSTQPKRFAKQSSKGWMRKTQAVVRNQIFDFCQNKQCTHKHEMKEKQHHAKELRDTKSATLF